jgi:hypothetical protein
VEIAIADEGEFLISGFARAGARPDNDGVGPLDGISWRDAMTIVMPIGRHHTIAFGPANAELHLDGAAVAELNRRQVRAAHLHVVWHPDADLLAFADQERARRPGGRAPRFPPGAEFDVTKSMGR